MTERCDGCGQDVPVAGGIANFWSRKPTETGGMRLELRDGTDHLLCFDCIEDLPEEAVAADIASLNDKP